jgi:hypothetical protein
MADDSKSGNAGGGGILSILKGGFPIKKILQKSPDKLRDTKSG